MNGWLVRYSRPLLSSPWPTTPIWRRRRTARFLTTARVLRRGDDDDARIRDLGRQISDDYAALRDHYATPKYPIVLAHGLLGFSELKIAASLPPIQYWHGIKDALAASGATVITASVPPSGSIEERAAKLAADIAAASQASSSSSPVNIIAHSMGGLDARYMIAHLRPPGLRVASLVTVATPHRGSAFADYLVEGRGLLHLPRLYGVIRRAGLGTGAFGQLTTRYMADEFNPRVADDPAVRYFSYGAATDAPPLLGVFRLPYRVVQRAEGANDGLVSVASSRWGAYKGTLVGVSHLDLINWSNRVRWTVREWMGMKKTFNAVAFYLDVADMLAREGL